MTLKNDYYEGSTGLHQKMKAAFDAGVAFVGTGTPEVSSLDFGDVNGAALDLVATTAKYFDVSSTTVDYRFWLFVDDETVPAASGKTLTQVTVLAGDSSVQVAQKVKTALLALSGAPFDVALVGNALLITNLVDGSTADISSGTLGGTAAATTVQQGVTPTGNYATLQAALKDAAQQGKATFTVTLTLSYNPTWIRQNKGDNYLKKSHFAGIQKGLSDSQIYDYECSLKLNVADSVLTKCDFNFTFQTA